jgi:hypothetical protein
MSRVKDQPNPTRCNYCLKPARHWLSYRGYIASARFGPSRPLLFVAACDEHVDCPNWTGIHLLHPEAQESHA